MLPASELIRIINARIAELHFHRTPKGLYDPITYVLSMGGKRLRPLLMLMAYNLYREDVQRVLQPALGIEIYHNYTLLHDDLMDRSDQRRGKKTVHKVWNENTAILSGDAMLVLAYQYMAQCPVMHLKEVMDLFSRTALEICEGQQLDMEFENRIDVTESEYIGMIRLKTSVLLASSLKIGAILGGASQEDANHLYDLGINMGLAFQLKDDYLDVYGDTALFGKKIGGDILCNKKTFLLIKAIECADSERLRQLKSWLEREIYDPAEKIKAVTDLYNSLQVGRLCEEKIEEYSSKALHNLTALKLLPEQEKEWKDLINELIYRKS